MSGPYDFAFISPSRAAELDDRHSEREWRKLAQNRGECVVCGQPEWTFGEMGMCFVCTTGESDASGDYEVQA